MWWTGPTRSARSRSPNASGTVITPGGPTTFGYGDTELGAKLRFVHEGDRTPQVGTYPPTFHTGDAEHDAFNATRSSSKSALPWTEPVVVEKAPVDDQYDSLFTLTVYGWSYHSFGRGTGTGSGGRAPFAGITVVGGVGPVGSPTNSSPRVRPAPRPLRTSYGVTVISTESSGGGLPSGAAGAAGAPVEVIIRACLWSIRVIVMTVRSCSSRTGLSWQPAKQVSKIICRIFIQSET